VIISIFVAKKSGEPARNVLDAQVVVGKGIAGDRNYQRNDYPGQNVTLIESEAVARYNAEYGQAIESGDTRRNIVTSGVDLNALVGQEFAIGQARFRGVELCTPCSSLGASLENQDISNAQVVKAFLNSGGLRVDVIASGTIAVGMAIETGDGKP